jgi:hypothetical protein
VGILRSIAILLAIAVGLCAQSASVLPETAAGVPTAAEIDSVMKDLSGITGFQIHKQIPFQLVTRDEVNRFLKDQIRRSVKPEEIRAEEVTLKMFGFVPQDFDLRQNTIDLLTEQAAAFYDFHRKKLFISDWATHNMRDAALVHELAHALADQNFPIEKFLNTNANDSEESLARQTVVEGQASWLMIEWAARRQGKSLADPANAERYLKLDSREDVDDSSFPVFGKEPLYIRRTLMFPYDEGGVFQQAVFVKEGKEAFSDVFRRPPATTAQILHPERYFGGVRSSAPGLPKPAPHSRKFIDGTLGELDQRILLRQYLNVELSDDLSPHMKGAAFRIDELKSSHRRTLVYVSEWDDESAAARYFEAYQQVLRGKWKQVEIADHSSIRFTGHSEEGYFRVDLQGRQVISTEGLETAEP